MEIWKDIEDYENLYQISSLGNVKSLNYNHTGKEKILKPNKSKFGYLYVVLCKEKEKNTTSYIDLWDRLSLKILITLSK